MSSCFYGTEYKLQGKWVAKDREASEFNGERTCIEVDDTSAPKVSFETVGESYYPQTMYSWDEDQLHWEIEGEIFTLHVLSGPGKLERPYQKYVTIENTKTKARKRYKLVEITEEEDEDTREWYKSVEDKIWCADSQWESLPTKDRIDNDDVTTLPTDKNGFIIKGTSLYGYDENMGGPIVNIPEGIKRIKARAFSKCEGITRVYIPDSVSSMGDGCFSGCKNLVNVRLPEGLVNISDSMFSGCENLQELNLPNTVTSIGGDSFASCMSLEEVTMPESLTNLGFRAFAGATGLKRITFNSKLKKIESAAFEGCTAVTELFIPASVTTIDMYAFSGCTALENIIVEDGNEKYFSKNNCLIVRENKSIVLACNNSVIPDDGSVEKIGKQAFSNCKTIESIILPETIEGIASCAFEGCSALRNIQLPQSMLYGYGDKLFAGCSSLEHFEIPSWMTKISNHMFSGCESLKEIKIPDFVSEIDAWAFSRCRSLTELVIPKSVMRIGSKWGKAGENGNFIRECSSLRRLEIEDGNPIYHSKDNCIIETKTGTLYAILENGVIPNDGSVTKIGENAFCACENLTEISLPECITTIGSNAFSQLHKLKEINIPKSVNEVGSGAFSENCNAVEEYNGVYYVGNWALGIVRKKAERTDLDDPNSLFVSISEEVFPDSGTITIREGTVGIGAYAFSFWDNLKSIYIPESVKWIGDYAFNASENLESCILREGLISIGECAFNDCKKLQSVTIPTTVKRIGAEAFRFCRGLQNLVISDTEIEIGRDAFAYCGDIPNIDIPERILDKLTHFRSTDMEDEGGSAVASEDYDGGDDDKPIPVFPDLDETNAEITSELFDDIPDGGLPF